MTVRFHWFAALAVLLAGLVLGKAAEAAEGYPILVYHRFDPSQAGETTVTDGVFERQLDWLGDHGFAVVPLPALLAVLDGQAAPAGRLAAITVDDGHASVYSELYPIILRRRIPVTLFIYPSAISRASYALTWEQLAEMRRSGLVEIQSHTFWHPDFRVEKRRQSAEDYRAFVDMQLRRSKAVLERRLGIAVDLLAWPYGIADPELEAAAARAGYRHAFLYSGGQARPGCDPLAIARIPVSNAAQGASFAALIGEGRRP